MKHGGTKSIQGNIKKKDIKNKKNTAEKCDQEEKKSNGKKSNSYNTFIKSYCEAVIIKTGGSEKSRQMNEQISTFRS